MGKRKRFPEPPPLEVPATDEELKTVFVQSENEVDTSSMYPLVVTVQGHPGLVAAFLKVLEETLPPFGLDKATQSALWGSARAGVAYVEYAYGYRASDVDLAAGATRYTEYTYELPTIDLAAEGMRILRSAAIRKAKGKMEQRAREVAEQMPLKLEFGIPVQKQKRRRRKELSDA